MLSDQDPDDDFEQALRQDLPRGLDRQARAIGRDRGLSARWLAADEVMRDVWVGEGGLLVGTRGGRTIGWKDDRHLLTIAGSRAGKGVSLIIPNLIFYEGSAVIIDPKGENAARTAGRRGHGTTSGGPGLNQDVYVLDPFGESGRPTASFNPLAALDAKSEDVVEDIGLFADALVLHPEQGERHWTESAQALIRALILLVVADPRFTDRRNLVTVRRLLTMADPAIAAAQDAVPEDMDQLTAQQALIRMLISQTETPYGYICIGMGEQLMGMGDNERGSVLSSARTQTCSD
jgi:type IV secretion system protein VirD4